MKILLLGEYSNVHATLAEGLRALGHHVVVASNGDFWKNYPRDIDLSRTYSHLGGLRLMFKLATLLPRFRGFDIVQLINPMFVELKAQHIRPLYNYLRRHNRRIVLGAYGMDYYWVNVCSTQKPLAYSDFNIGNQLRTDPDAQRERTDWIGTPKEKLNQLIAHDCDHIITALYEYDVCYRPYFPHKTTFIPLPINIEKATADQTQPYPSNDTQRIKIFLGINKTRSTYKGTDVMLRAARRIEKEYADRVELRIAESVPYEQYQQLMNGADLILDQLYSYTPSMNPLLAMAKGIVCVGGGEEENYQIINEHQLRPSINVKPNEESVYQALKAIVEHPEQLPLLKQQSQQYVAKHHHHLKVAQQYEKVYQKLLQE